MGLCASFPDPNPLASPQGRAKYSFRGPNSSNSECDEAHIEALNQERTWLALSEEDQTYLAMRPVVQKFTRFSTSEVRKRARIAQALWLASADHLNRAPALIGVQSLHPLYAFYAEIATGKPARVCGVSLHKTLGFALHVFVLRAWNNIELRTEVSCDDIACQSEWSDIQMMLIEMCDHPGYFCDPLSPLLKPL